VAGKFGVFTDTTATNNKLVAGTSSDIFLWNGASSGAGNLPPFEGSNVIAWAYTAPGQWWGGGIQARQARDLTNFRNGSLKFRIKIPANVSFNIGVGDTYTNQNWVNFPANTTAYGLVRNGDWAQGTIPVSTLIGPKVALQSLLDVFMISSDANNLPASTFQFAIDDIVYDSGTGGTTPPPSSGPTSVTQTSATTLQFRDEVRAFLEAELPSDLQHKVLNHLRLSKDDYVRWHKILARQGWVAPGWPREYGGPGWTRPAPHLRGRVRARRHAAHHALRREHGGAGHHGLRQPGPEGHYLPRILSCEDWWCQGYSEPGAGSDLASLKTTALRDGDHYIVNGQKTWTTLAQHADMIFCLVRTDSGVRKQEGISFLLIDMHSPGITVRPIVMLDEDHEVNEVFFDNVRVPVENLVGQENRGWTYAKYLLGHERTGIAAVGRSKRELARLKRMALREQKNGAPLMQDPLFGARVAELEIELMALEMTVLRVLAQRRQARRGPEASCSRCAAPRSSSA
jgi:alkylation response protein AidB-like acyl-CoA dehydrogenase